LSLCTTFDPLHDRFSNLFGSSIAEATMRPNPKVESRRVLEDGMKELIRGTVADPAVAELLVPDYPVFCKRTPIVDDYWPMFNRPNVSLVRPPGATIGLPIPHPRLVSPITLRLALSWARRSLGVVSPLCLVV
jgi:cation diffusion facilitator CzcD-associated flavoprotein CzcO